MNITYAYDSASMDEAVYIDGELKISSSCIPPEELLQALGYKFEFLKGRHGFDCGIPWPKTLTDLKFNSATYTYPQNKYNDLPYTPYTYKDELPTLFEYLKLRFNILKKRWNNWRYPENFIYGVEKGVRYKNKDYENILGVRRRCDLRDKMEKSKVI